MKKTLMEEIEKIKKEYRKMTVEKTISNYFDEVLKIEEFYVREEKFIFNKVLNNIILYRNEAFEVGKLKRKLIDKKPFKGKVDKKAFIKDISIELKQEIDNICNEGLLEIKNFLLMVYYTRNCIPIKGWNCKKFYSYSDFIKYLTGKDYKISKLKETTDVEEREFLQIYDRIRASIDKIQVKISDDEVISAFSKKYQEHAKKLEEESLEVEDKDKIIFTNINNKYENEVYSSLLFPERGKEDMKFYIENLSKNLAFKRIQSGRVNLIKKSELDKLEIDLVKFYNEEKDYSLNQSKILAKNFIKSYKIDKDEEYYKKIESICQEVLDNLAVEIACIITSETKEYSKILKGLKKYYENKNQIVESQNMNNKILDMIKKFQNQEYLKNIIIKNEICIIEKCIIKINN